MTCRHSSAVLRFPHPRFTEDVCRECGASKKWFMRPESEVVRAALIEWLWKPYLADGVALSPGFVDRVVFPDIPEELFWSEP